MAGRSREGLYAVKFANAPGRASARTVYGGQAKSRRAEGGGGWCEGGEQR